MATRIVEISADIEFVYHIAWTRTEDGRWVGRTQPFGMTLYGDTQEEINDRMVRGADFFVSTFQQFPFPDSINIMRAYLDSHAIDHTVNVRFDKSAAVRPSSSADEAPASDTYRRQMVAAGA